MTIKHDTFGTQWAGGDKLAAADLNDTMEYVNKPFGGDGTDGALAVAGATNLNLDQVYQYSSVTVDAGQTLSTGGSNGVMILLVQGDCDINGTINLSAKGTAGGAGGAPGAIGVAGTNYDSNYNTYMTAGGGCAAPPAVGAASTTAYKFLNSGHWFRRNIISGTGGGGGMGGGPGGGGGGGASFINAGAVGVAGQVGGVPPNFAGGAGGAGGACLYIEVAGDLTIGAAGLVDASGENGVAGTGGAGRGGGGGGGGGAGNIIILVKGTITNNGATDITGGAGGAGGAFGGGAGGVGGAGLLVLENI